VKFTAKSRFVLKFQRALGENVRSVPANLIYVGVDAKHPFSNPLSLNEETKPPSEKILKRVSEAQPNGEGERGNEEPKAQEKKKKKEK
jgi:hypothetical protein